MKIRFIIFILCVIQWLPAQPLSKETLFATDGESGDAYGDALAVERQWLFVGAPGEGHLLPHSGAVYVYQRRDARWQLFSKLQPARLAAEEAFGQSLASTTDWLCVGAPGYRLGSGGVYVFHRQHGKWRQQQLVLPPEFSPPTGFGRVIAMHKLLLAVAARADRQRPAAVYLYRQNGRHWELVLTLLPPGGQSVPGFGESLALTAEHLIIGAPTEERVLIYSLATGRTTPEKILEAPGGCAGFGSAVLMRNHMLIVGAPGNSSESAGTGRILTYSSTDKWQLQEQLSHSGSSGGTRFGSSLAGNEQYLLVGAPGSSPGYPAGAVQLYSTSTPLHHLGAFYPAENPADARFGQQIALIDDQAIAGMPLGHGRSRRSGLVHSLNISDRSIALSKSIPPLFLPEDFVRYPVARLDTIFSDPLHNLHFEAQTCGLLRAGIEDRRLIFYSLPNRNGDCQVMVYALHEGLQTDSLAIQVKIIPVNDLPKPFPLHLPADGDTIQRGAEILFSWEQAVDVDGDELFYSLIIDDGKQEYVYEDIVRTHFSFPAGELPGNGRTWRWTVKVTDGRGSVTSSDSFAFGVSPAEHGSFPAKAYLEQNHPNPFNPLTVIPFELSGKAAVRLIIYNILGQPVRELIQTTLPAGRHLYYWDGRDSSGNPLASGAYIYRLQVNNHMRSRKLMLTR